MTKRSKKNIKKRNRKQLLRRIRESAKYAVPNSTHHEGNHLIYQKALSEKYNGKVTSKEKYLNPRAVILHFCNSCDTEFYGRPTNMLGENYERHNCSMPYGDSRGRQFLSVSTISKHKSKKKRKDEVNTEKFYEMVINDYTPQEISKELDISVALVKDYFKTEGLI